MDMDIIYLQVRQAEGSRKCRIWRALGSKGAKGNHGGQRHKRRILGLQAQFPKNPRNLRRKLLLLPHTDRTASQK